MSHHLGPPAPLVPEPVVRMDQLIRLTARLVARMIPLTPTDQPSAAEVDHERGHPLCSRSRRLHAPCAGGSR
jgi:hypothetical protein